MAAHGYDTPRATSQHLGDIKVGSGLSVTLDGTLSTINNGTVTSVAVVAPVEFTVSGSPITSSGTITLTKKAQAVNRVYAAPAGGSSGVPTFRFLDPNDIPGLPYVYSVDLAAPVEFTVSGNPITSTGTLTLTKATQSANTHWAGPTSGAAAAPTFRSLVSADIPALAYVTSVGLAAPAEFTVSGSPVSSSGTLTLTKATQARNTVFAGPVAGGAAVPTFRTLTATDIPALGYVTSVALAAPAEFTVSGSPITTSGTLTLTKATQSPNLVYSGPSSGGAAAPTFRSLVSADIPALAYVTSAALTMPAEFSVAGSPITSAGTFTVTKATETANTLWAGPTSGGAAAPTFRTLVAADVPLAALANITVPWIPPEPQTLVFGPIAATVQCYLATSGGTVFTDVTAAITGSSPGQAINFGAVSDALYIGTTSAATDRFAYFTMSHGTNASWSLSAQWEYWNGSFWNTFPAASGLGDGTAAASTPLTATTSPQKLGFAPPSDWATVAVNGNTRYWIRCRVSVFTSRTTSPTYWALQVSKVSNQPNNGAKAPFNATITAMYLVLNLDTGVQAGVTGPLLNCSAYFYNNTTNTLTSPIDLTSGQATGLSIALSATDNFNMRVFNGVNVLMQEIYPMLYLRPT